MIPAMPLLLVLLLALQEKEHSPVILQGFYWDYPQDWYVRLSKDAPRLREITAIWTPPPSKGAGGRDDVGYGVFDHYDLGDKFQRGAVATRGGTRDDLLRMIGTMHANGIDVILDHDPRAPDLGRCRPREGADHVLSGSI